MNSPVASVVKFAQPGEVICRLHPCSDIAWITDSWIVTLKPSEVHSILKGELDVRMMEFKTSCALREISSVRPDRALRSRLRTPAVSIEIDIVRISCPRLVIGVVDRV